MALTRPILNKVPAWDTTKGYAFTFNVVGGDQVTGSILTITDAVDGSVVYENTQTSYAFINEVPADASGLENGGYYNATLKTVDINGNQSADSNAIQFYCYSTPTITIDGFELDNPIIDSSEYPFVATYQQQEGERLNTYRFILYDSTGREVANSGIKYASNLTPQYSDDAIVFTLEHTFTGLENGGYYSIEIICDTINETRISTGKKPFGVDFKTSSAYAEFTATNVCDKGYILVESNAIIVEGQAYPEATYIDNDAIDLRQDGSYVVFNQGYRIPSNFTAKMWFSDVVHSDIYSGRIWNFQNGRIVVDILKSKTNDNALYCKVVVNNAYIIFSDEIVATSSDKLCVQLRKINNIYEVQLEKVV